MNNINNIGILTERRTNSYQKDHKKTYTIYETLVPGFISHLTYIISRLLKKIFKVKFAFRNGLNFESGSGQISTPNPKVEVENL